MNDYDAGLSVVRLVLIGMAMAGALVGILAGLVRWMGQRIMSELDARLSRVDDVMREVVRVDTDLKRLVAELPLHYQRREDSIREYTALNAKIDRIYELMVYNLELRHEKPT